MPLDLPANTRCFVDATIWFYHFVAHPTFSGAISAWKKAFPQAALAASSVATISARDRLMTNNALIVAVMEREALPTWSPMMTISRRLPASRFGSRGNNPKE